jgi:hypothetical protein
MYLPADYLNHLCFNPHQNTSFSPISRDKVSDHVFINRVKKTTRECFFLLFLNPYKIEMVISNKVFQAFNSAGVGLVGVGSCFAGVKNSRGRRGLETAR